MWAQQRPVRVTIARNLHVRLSCIVTKRDRTVLDRREKLVLQIRSFRGRRSRVAFLYSAIVLRRAHCDLWTSYCAPKERGVYYFPTSRRLLSAFFGGCVTERRLCREASLSIGSIHCSRRDCTRWPLQDLILL